MKKVTVFVGSAHKRLTHKAVVQFLEKLQALGDIETEIVTLSNYKLGHCRGCRVCFDKGEQFCPLKDDRDMLMEKIAASDGVVFATPNYCWQVSGIMKTFIDRFGCVCHRPRYFGKSFTCIVTQGFGGADKIVAYLDNFARFLGFNVVKGSYVTGLDPWTEKVQRKIDKTLTAHSRRFYASLMKSVYPQPSFYMLMGFRMGRTAVRQELDERSYDYRYYRDQGWFDSDYFYPTQLGPIKKLVGSLSDRMALTIRKMVELGA